ncbi:MAG: AI-2E family transporter [Candidatus Paceibacteria bacterium]
MKFSYIQQFFFFSLLVITSGIFLWMLGKYLFPVFWAVVIALVFYPLYQKILKKLRGWESVASLATLVSVVLMVLLPLVFVSSLVVRESLDLYENVSGGANNSETDFLGQAGVLTSALEPYGITQTQVEDRLRGWVSDGSQALASSLLVFGQGTASFLISVVIMLYLLFFFFRDGKRLKKIIIHYLPFGDGYEERLFTRFSETTQAVVKGTFIIALLQGVIGGVAFAIVGVPNPILWGVAMGLLAILPGVGTPLVWAPVGVYLLFTNAVWEGVTILLVGILLISVIDEFLRPILVGRRAKMPDALVLLATIGGLATFGVTGFIAGPVIAAFFLSLWTIFEERYHSELTSKDR